MKKNELPRGLRNNNPLNIRRNSDVFQGRWAPPKENHTEKYIQFVSDYAGIPADDPININDREQMIRIVAGMSRFENGREADMSDVIAGWNLL